MCKLCHLPGSGFIQTLVAYHSLDSSDAEPPDKSEREEADVPAVDVVEWLENSAKLAANENLVSSDALVEEVFTNVADETLSPMSTSVEAGTITDVCNSANLPEVEILSLIEEQIPKYRLRADTITDFQGYNNEDWIQTPIISIDTDLELTEEQIEETLKYFILCSERVTQMTKTFNDIEAVNRLLEEKERDLELAARIGQTLLEKNKQLCGKNEELEEQLAVANDKVNQLRHDISMKDELLRFYCQDLENAETESSDGSPAKPFNLSSVDLDALQKRVLSLEEDNLGLRLEAIQLKSNTETYEEKEQKLVTDCVEQLNQVHEQLEGLSNELIKKAEENMRQKEEITTLLAQIVDQQKKSKTQTIENMELSKHLEAAQSSQRSLTRELADLQDRYDELFELLEEAQDELKLLRSKDKPRAVRSHYMSTPYLPTDSLASELQSSLKGELDFAKGLSSLDRRMHNWKIFETARAAKRASERRATSRNSLLVPGSHSSRGCESVESAPSSVRSSLYLSDGESAMSDGYSADMDSSHGFEREGATSMTPPFQCWTPDSLMSAGSTSGISGYSNMSANSQYKLPEKLQIVKPMEGSVTLKRWQMLATPHMGGIFEERPGVVTKGQKKLDVDEETYNLSDLEEDDDMTSCPSKRINDTGSVYTYTNSTAAHSVDNTEMTPSAATARMSAIPGSAQSNALRERRPTNYTMSLGLAAILNERGLNSKPDQGIGLRINSAPLKPLPTDMADSSYESMTTSATNSCVTAPDEASKSNSVGETSMKLAMKEGESGKSFIQRLKNKSRSLYNIWNTNPGHSDLNVSSSVDGPALTKATSESGIATTATQSGEACKVVSSPSESQEGAAARKQNKSNVLRENPGIGVLGALTNFRKSGLL
ncbi:trafficking kinesin-binding protein 1-like isoform X3 [Liolophura sinensis]|uniref:trafficking kinesin-binding protein 1-like isoform X3 n=1 Tax=Liolophura sinensis TaxID=3198878 RepID=UPI00315983A5